MSEEEKKCKLGVIDFEGDCWEKDKLVLKLIDDANFALSPQAKAYIGAMPTAKSEYGKRGVDTQIAYILCNLTPENKKQDLAVQQLDDIIKGETPSTVLTERDPNEIGEIEYGRISNGFERYTQGQIGDLQRVRDKVEYEEVEETPEILNKINKLKLTMEDFVEYSRMRDIPVDKVLVAQPWSDDVLVDEVLKAKKEAEKRIKIDW